MSIAAYLVVIFNLFDHLCFLSQGKVIRKLHLTEIGRQVMSFIMGTESACKESSKNLHEVLGNQAEGCWDGSGAKLAAGAALAPGSHEDGLGTPSEQRTRMEAKKFSRSSRVMGKNLLLLTEMNLVRLTVKS
jgi:hypothetical protein